VAWTYLLQDLFTTADDDQITSPRECEPTGDLAFVQTDGGQALAGGKHTFTAQSTPVWGDQGFYDNNGQTRDSGLALYTTLNLTTWEECGIGWHTAAAVVDPDSMEHAIQANTTDGRLDTEGGTPIATGLSTSTDYDLVQILRSAGCHYVLDGNLLWVEEAGQDTASIRPAFASLDGAGSNDDLAVVDLPANGQTDWDTDFSDVEHEATAAGSGSTYSCSADIHYHAEFTYESGTYVQLRYRENSQSNSIYTYALTAGGTLRVIRLVGGGSTTILTASSVFSDGVYHYWDTVAVGDTIKVFVDGVQRGSDITESQWENEEGGRIYHTLATNDLDVKINPTPSLGIADARIICPQASDTETHSADCIFYARGVHLPSADSLRYELRKSGSDEITLDIDSNGLPTIEENGTARITGSNSDVSDGDDVCVRLNGDTVDLFVNGSEISSAYESLTLTTGTGFNMASIGTAGWTESVDMFPQDVSDLIVEDEGVTVTPNVGTLTIEGHDPTVGFTQDISPNLGTVAATGYNPTVSFTQAIAASAVGALTVEGHNPTVTFVQAVTPNVGQTVIRGFKTTIEAVGGAIAGGITRIAMKMATILRR